MTCRRHSPRTSWAPTAPTSRAGQWQVTRSRPRARLGVYRHHVFASLGTALAATFPRRCRRWSGRTSSAASRALSSGTPCRRSRCSTEYGADFAAFIAGCEAARDLPYLADVARLDWALNLAFHAPPLVIGCRRRTFPPSPRSGWRRCRSPGRPARPDQFALSFGPHRGDLPTGCRERNSRSEFRRLQPPGISAARRRGVCQPECGRGGFRRGIAGRDVARRGRGSGFPGRSGV